MPHTPAVATSSTSHRPALIRLSSTADDESAHGGDAWAVDGDAAADGGGDEDAPVDDDDDAPVDGAALDLSVAGDEPRADVATAQE